MSNKKHIGFSIKGGFLDKDKKVYMEYYYTSVRYLVREPDGSQTAYFRNKYTGAREEVIYKW